MKKVMYLKAESFLENGKECAKLRFQNYRLEDRKRYPDDQNEIIIYRREDNGCDFNLDGLEHYNGLMPTKKDVIFRGIIPPKNTISEFIDHDTERFKTYIYWVGKGEIGACIAGPVVVKMRNTNIWWHYDIVLEECERLKQNFQGIEIKTVGYTVKNRPIQAVLIGNKENMLACAGAIHAGESGPEIILSAARYILENKPELFQNAGLAFVPTVNIDNREKMVCGHPTYLRVNENGVDLNRNFNAQWQEDSFDYGLSTAEPMCVTYKGPFPESEPETRALVSFIETVEPKLVLSYHWMCSVSSDNMLAARNAEKDFGFTGKLSGFAKNYSDAFRQATELSKKESKVLYLCSPGSFITWLYSKGIPAFDLEMSPDLNGTVFQNAERDQTTEEMLEISIKGHTAGIISMLEMLGNK